MNTGSHLILVGVLALLSCVQCRIFKSDVFQCINKTRTLPEEQFQWEEKLLNLNAECDMENDTDSRDYNSENYHEDLELQLIVFVKRLSEVVGKASDIFDKYGEVRLRSLAKGKCPKKHRENVLQLLGLRHTQEIKHYQGKRKFYNRDRLRWEVSNAIDTIASLIVSVGFVDSAESRLGQDLLLAEMISANLSALPGELVHVLEHALHIRRTLDGPGTSPACLDPGVYTPDDNLLRIAPGPHCKNSVIHCRTYHVLALLKRGLGHLETRMSRIVGRITRLGAKV